MSGGGVGSFRLTLSKSRSLFGIYSCTPELGALLSIRPAFLNWELTQMGGKAIFFITAYPVIQFSGCLNSVSLSFSARLTSPFGSTS